ncbi:CRISPR-associated endonuclease Cas3'' [Ectothiorhodospiraceae bacterium BW-2]|nr:CRISPR-associated endonuclease Cas3'' [Ectothiorhodospiraceae bacterium BW-2]
MSTFTKLNISKTIWAKSGDPKFHPLLAHILDVAAVAETILLREPPQTKAWLAQQLYIPEQSVAQFVAFICGLHDFGKATPGFQAKWQQGADQDRRVGLIFEPKAALKQDRHDLSSAYLLQQALQSVIGDSDCCRSLAMLLGAHHGYFPKSNEIKQGKPSFEKAIWNEARTDLLKMYCQIVMPEMVYQPKAPPECQDTLRPPLMRNECRIRGATEEIHDAQRYYRFTLQRGYRPR